MTPEQVLANWRGEAAVLRSRGHVGDARLLEQCADEISETLGELEFVSETQAALYSGRSGEYLRSRHQGWVARGLARTVGRLRYYRRCVLEFRGNVEAQRAAGRRAAGDAA